MQSPLQILQMLQSSKNPAGVLQGLFGGNPLFQRAMQMGQGKSVQDLQQIAKNLATQGGVDMEQFNLILSQFGIKL